MAGRSGLDSGAGAFLARVRAYAAAPALPSRPDLAALVEETAAALDAEEPSLRPPDSHERPGGIVELPALPTVLVPDLHARPYFIASVLGWTPPGFALPLAFLLETGRVNLVCLGDVFHSEAGSASRRWAAAYREYASLWATREAMDEEMRLSLTTARIVLEAKLAFPANFHCLKGNHENIADEEGRGDHSFYKFVDEGAMVVSWFRDSYDEGLLIEYHELELDLPLLAIGPNFIASHGEPAFALSRADIVEYRSRPDVVEALIWTANGDAEEGSVAQSLDALLGTEKAEGALWFAGHRPVAGKYSLRAGGKFVQFHNPIATRIVFLESGRAPDPNRDILEIPLY